ncbi:MAG: diaminopimelate decarboxylase [Alphaproteobacteria bacterium]|nr:diaminopimelate decarboxylase [Alphaproteobacteria bacterium]
METCFTYHEGRLHGEGVALPEIARHVGTPLYCYSASMLENAYKAFSEAFSSVPHMICYAMKANSNQAVLKLLASHGSGMDIVSAGELQRALVAGVRGEQIVFSGVGKTREEIANALDAGILCFNVELEAELLILSELAQAKGLVAPVAIRVNPDVDARTHEKISTGGFKDKFGVPISRAQELYKLAASLPFLEVRGIAMHIGSQITELGPFETAVSRLVDLVHVLRSDGHCLRHIDVGGGLGVSYCEEMQVPFPLPLEDYARMIMRLTSGLGLGLILEPGRLIVAHSGLLLTRVIHSKQGEKKTFIIVDAAMNDLIRPTLYGAYHAIKPVCEVPDSLPWLIADVVGGICESGDFFALDRRVPSLSSGDLVAVMTAGAYGAVQASTYNTRPLIPEVLVRGSCFQVVRPRETCEAIIARDIVPDWLT